MSEERRFKTFEEFFASRGYYDVGLIFYESTGGITVEEMFQHFRERIMAEVRDAYGG